MRRCVHFYGRILIYAVSPTQHAATRRFINRVEPQRGEAHDDEEYREAEEGRAQRQAEPGAVHVHVQECAAALLPTSRGESRLSLRLTGKDDVCTSIEAPWGRADVSACTAPSWRARREGPRGPGEARRARPEQARAWRDGVPLRSLLGSDKSISLHPHICMVTGCVDYRTFPRQR